MSYVRSAFLKNIANGSKTIALECVDKTSTWTRPSGFPSAQVKDDIAKAVEQNIHKLNPRTVKVAMKSVFIPVNHFSCHHELTWNLENLPISLKQIRFCITQPSN